MNADLLGTLTDPAILFFIVGVGVGLVGSNLEIPPPIAKFFSLYLLLAIGFKGGQSLREVGASGELFTVLAVALSLSILIPASCFMFLRRRIDSFDAAAIAATYGSVSAVTFVVASDFVATRNGEPGGHMAVALVVMESPAIVMAVLLATWVRSRSGDALEPDAERISSGSGGDVVVMGEKTTVSLRRVLHEAFTDGAHLLLIGAMVVGMVSGQEGGEAMEPFTGSLFKGILAFFLLEMGLLVARQLRQVGDVGVFLVGFGVAVPFINGTIAVLIGDAVSMSISDVVVLAALAASGSYIVVPAVVRYAIPEARPSRYFTLALGVTFPVNILVGIPVFHRLATLLA